MFNECTWYGALISAFVYVTLWNIVCSVLFVKVAPRPWLRALIIKRPWIVPVAKWLALVVALFIVFDLWLP